MAEQQLPVAGEAPRPGVAAPASASAHSAYRAAVRAFGDIAGALNETAEQDDLLHLIAMHICELAGISRCSVYLRDPKTELFRGQVGHPGREGDSQVKRLVAGTEADRFTHEIVATLRPVVLTDALHDPRPIRSTMRHWGIRSMLGVPMVLRGEVVGLVFLDDADHPHTFTEEETELASTFADMAAVVIAQAQMTARLRSSLKTVARQNDLLRRAASMDDRLTELVLEGGNLSEIAAAAAELTGKPCDIYDGDGRRLAGAVPAWLEDKAIPRVLDPEYRSVPAVKEALDALGDKDSGVIGPLPAAGLNHRFLLAPITTRDDSWGSLVVMEFGSRFGPLDMHIARRAATNAALELSAERRAARAEWDARSSLAGELIRGNPDVVALRRRAEYLGVDLDAPHVVCLVGTDGSGAGALPTAAEFSAAFAETAEAGTALATGVTEGMLVVLALDASRPALETIGRARDRVASVLEQLAAPDVTLVGAVSTRCCAPADYPGAYGQAQQVMACLQSFAQEGRALVLTADDLGPGRLFLASSSRVEADRFANDALSALLVEGDAAMADLLATLRMFFDNSRSVRKSAQALDVHENTVRYRLGRIEELTGLAVGSDSDDQLTAQLALLIVRIQGWPGTLPGAAG
ncbi:MAG: hypothetical protein QOH30_181 [Baekduia sp.]|jgi:GAF domain-containing protein|nr:hypothetical protein [Baekduia sp.]